MMQLFRTFCESDHVFGLNLLLRLSFEDLAVSLDYSLIDGVRQWALVEVYCLLYIMFSASA
jgi:hypothetical protein